MRINARRVLQGFVAAAAAVTVGLFAVPTANAAPYPIRGVYDIPANAAFCATPDDGDLEHAGGCAVDRIEKFLSANYGTATVRPAYKAVTQLSAGVVWGSPMCAWTYVLLNYCAPNDTVYSGLQNTAGITDNGKKAGVAAMFAHELGHHLQTEPRAGGTQAYVGYTGTKFEDQADCVAGAFMAYGQSQGWYNQADVDTVRGYFQAIGAAPDSGNAHSTGDTRVAMYNQGLAGGLAGCVSIVPDMPII